MEMHETLERKVIEDSLIQEHRIVKESNTAEGEGEWT